MKLFSKQLSGPDISLFLIIFQSLLEKFGQNDFTVDEAIEFINSNEHIVWGYRSNKSIREVKKNPKSKDKHLLDLQNACHCFAGRLQSAVIDKESGEKFQLLEHLGPLKYRILKSLPDIPIFKEFESSILNLKEVWEPVRISRLMKSLTIGSFKAISKTQSIPIKPLTLIFGPNSSGKSSIIHSLLLARHGLDTGDLDVYYPSIAGTSVDLGGFKQYVNRGDCEKRVVWGVVISLPDKEGDNKINDYNWGDEEEFEEARIEFEIGVETVPQLSKLGDMEDVDTGEMIIASKPKISINIYLGDDLLFRLEERENQRIGIAYVNTDHFFVTWSYNSIAKFTTIERISDQDIEYLNECYEKIARNIEWDAKNFIPVPIKDEPLVGFKKKASPVIPISKENRLRELGEALTMFLPNQINNLLLERFYNLIEYVELLKYLGPIRHFPPRTFSFSKEHDSNWEAGGGSAWERLVNDDNLRNEVNEWLNASDKLDTKYELIVRNLFTDGELQQRVPYKLLKALHNFLVEYWTHQEHDEPFSKDMIIDNTLIYDSEGVAPDVLEYITKFVDVDENVDIWLRELSEKKESDFRDMVMLDKKSNTIVTHRDIGIGISQVLPVLVHALGSEDEIIAIEQPELHLHPGLQAELGDLFIESAMGKRKNTFILETHSEHLILRILRRIRETKDGELPDGKRALLPEDVSVIYVEPTSEGTILHHLEITEDGDFKQKWPDGFFDERAKELF